MAFLGGGVVLGFVQGGLLPWECQGLACLFTQVILMYTGIVVAVWLVAGIALALARRRWPRSQWRLGGLRLLALSSWVPLAGLVVVALDI